MRVQCDGGLKACGDLEGEFAQMSFGKPCIGLEAPNAVGVERGQCVRPIDREGELDDEELRVLLADRRSLAEERLALYEQMRDETATDRALQLRLATLENGIAHLRAEIAWIDDTEGRML